MLHERPQYTAFEVVARALAFAVSITAGCIVLFCAYTFLTAITDPDPSHDPHGYARIFSVIVGVPALLLAAITLPFVFAQRMWLRAFIVVAIVLELAVGALVVVLVVDWTS